MNVLSVRRRQLPPLTRRLPWVSPWQPAAAVGLLALAFVATTPRVGDDPELRLRLAGVAMAAMLAFVLDDRAATTLASSPLTLLERRALRLGVVVPVVELWWFGLVGLLSVRRAAPLPPTSTLLVELAAYTAIGFAGCVWSQRRSDDGTGGTAGAVIVAAAFFSTWLPLPAWWPLTESRFHLVLAVALVALVAGSLDPATRRRSGGR